MPGYQWKGARDPEPKATEVPPRKKRELKPCGTPAAYKRHKLKGETPCEPCAKAQARYMALYKAGLLKTSVNKTLAPCGTKSSYDRHIRNHEEPCAKCSQANAEASRIHYWRTKQERMIADKQAA